MARFALLCGSAPDDFRQRKLNNLFDSLANNDNWNLTVMANGINEVMLEYVLNNILDSKSDGILLYFCTKSPVLDSEKSLWLCGDEIRKDIVSYYEGIAHETGTDFQVIYESDQEFIREEELGWEKVC